MKKLALSIAFLAVVSTVNAQRQNVYFLKNNGRQVTLRDSADFIRIIQEPDSGTVQYKLLEYYPDGAKKTIGLTSRIDPITYEGVVAQYNKKGKRISSISYLDGIRNGTGYYFFDNGTLSSQIEYYREGNQANSKTIYFADSNGTVLVKDGNGHFIEKNTNKNGEVLTEEGDYKDGIKDGEWTFKNSSGQYWNKELFERGKFIEGETFDKGKDFKYTVMESPPEFIGGPQAFYNYLKRFVKYPSDAYSKGIKGKVYLSFVVDQEGRVRDIIVDQSAYPSLDAEAVRVMRESPRWKPGIQRGLPVRVKYKLPISFNF